MKRATLLGVLVAVFVLQSAWAVYTQTQKPPGPLRTEHVKGDLHMISGEGGNVALYATSDGVILVDDMFERNHADILAQAKTVTDRLEAAENNSTRLEKSRCAVGVEIALPDVLRPIS